jgi:hypothetical protein
MLEHVIDLILAENKWLTSPSASPSSRPLSRGLLGAAPVTGVRKSFTQ